MSDDSTAALRLPPQSAEAEAAVLGGLLLDNTAWDRVGDFLRETDFYRADHRLIYSAIYRLVEQSRPADAVTVYEHLQSIGKAEEAGGLGYINSLAPGDAISLKHSSLCGDRPRSVDSAPTRQCERWHRHIGTQPRWEGDSADSR